MTTKTSVQKTIEGLHTAIIRWVSHSASILLAYVSETLTLFDVAYANETGCKSWVNQGFGVENASSLTKPLGLKR
jgi:hypothetical protein